MMRQVAGRLPGHGRPCYAAVRTAIDAVSGIGHPDIDGLGCVAGCPGSRIKRDPSQPHDIALVVVARHLNICSCIRKGSHFIPRYAVVRAFPQSVAAAGAEEEDAVFVRVDRQAFAHRTSRHVAADLERQLRFLPGIPFVS